MSLQALVWVLEECDATRGARCMMFAVANHCDELGQGCWARVETLAHEARMTRAAAQRALKRLEEDGTLEITGTTRRGTKIRGMVGMRGSARAGGRRKSTPGGVDTTQPGASLLSPNLSSEPVKNQTNGSEPLPQLDEFEEWLKHYHEVTGNTAVRGSKPARDLFKQRRRDWTTEDLKVATIGCNADHWRRQNGHVVPETILRASNVEKYRLAGLKAIADSKHERGEDEASAERRRSMEAQGLVEDFDL